MASVMSIMGSVWGFISGSTISGITKIILLGILGVIYFWLKKFLVNQSNEANQQKSAADENSADQQNQTDNNAANSAENDIRNQFPDGKA